LVGAKIARRQPDESEEVGAERVAAGGDAPELLQLVEQALDVIARKNVEHAVDDLPVVLRLQTPTVHGLQRLDDVPLEVSEIVSRMIHAPMFRVVGHLPTSRSDWHAGPAIDARSQKATSRHLQSASIGGLPATSA